MHKTWFFCLLLFLLSSHIFKKIHFQAKRRQKEKQEEEKWQEDTREVWMHQVVAEGIYEQKSKALYPLEFGSPDKSVSEALDQLDYQTFVYRTQSHAQKEPDVSLGSVSLQFLRFLSFLTIPIFLIRHICL